MIIILEGCDGIGKTTLAKSLCKKYGLRYDHPPTPTEDFENFSKEITMYYDYSLGVLDDCVFDRSFYSEYAYNFVNRKLDYVHEFEEKYYDKIVFILMTFYNHNIDSLDFWKNEELDDFYKMEKRDKVKLINTRYQIAFHKSILKNKIMVPFNGDYKSHHETIIKYVDKFLGRKDEIGKTLK